MKRISIYEFKDYKAFVIEWIVRTPNKGRGQRRRLAEAIGCQTPFVTHVLSGQYHFSLEQAEACARWMGLSEEETEFFILLVVKQRAGTKSLENLVAKRISKQRESQTVLKKRLEIKESMRLEDQLQYYNRWHIAAIHIACTIPELQNLEALQKYFRLPLNQILAALEFLTQHGFIEQGRAGGYKVVKAGIHLEVNSPLMSQHHSNWRLRAIEAINRRQNSDLFYSGVTSVSREDFEWLREKLSQFLEQAIERVKVSKEETLVGLNFDLFEV
jgi:uncharacterized protein (TIGR02147 family)